MTHISYWSSFFINWTKPLQMIFLSISKPLTLAPTADRKPPLPSSALLTISKLLKLKLNSYLKASKSQSFKTTTVQTATKEDSLSVNKAF